MTARAKPMAGAPEAALGNWSEIQWPEVEKHVKRLQIRIAKAIKNQKPGRAKALQWLLTHSFYGKLMAVKRVAQNRGGKTPGIDNVVLKTDNHKIKLVRSLSRRGYSPSPLRRIYIPKKDGSKRPLGIPTIKCRCQQALHLLALDPVAETVCDLNSYGFRPKRSCADAIDQCFKILHKKQSSHWVLEGDIQSCFDKISHPWLLKNIPMDRKILEKWLTCGFIDKGKLFPTPEGTPQGGIISPTLLNLTLKGLEAKVTSMFKESDKVHVVVYADDFIVTGISKEILEQKVKPAIEEFLKERGLKLSPTKTRITHIDQGFDFLGFNVRKYNGKLLIKPSKDNVKTFLKNLRVLVKNNPTAKTENLIYLMNPKIRGWVNYFRHVVSSKTFNYIDHQVFKMLWQWAQRRHSNRSRRWVWKKYFAHPSTWNGTLTAAKNGKITSVYCAGRTQIKRHVKIRSLANPYDPSFDEYFEKRRRRKSNRKEQEIFPIESFDC